MKHKVCMSSIGNT